MRTIILLFFFLSASIVFAQPVQYKVNYYTQKSDMILKWQAIMDSIAKYAENNEIDSFYIQYECDTTLSSKWIFSADTLYIDTCYSAIPTDTCLWDLINGHLEPDGIDSVISENYRTDNISSFTPDLYETFEVNCDTSTIDNSLIDSVSFTASLLIIDIDAYDSEIQVDDWIWIDYDCVSADCDTNPNGKPSASAKVESIIEYEDSVVYSLKNLLYVACLTPFPCATYVPSINFVRYLSCDDSIAVTTYPVTIDDDVNFQAQIYAPNMDSLSTSRQLYYDTKDGKVTYGMMEPFPDTCLWELGFISADGDYSLLDYSTDYNIASIEEYIVNKPSYDVYTTDDINVGGELMENDAAVSRWRGVLGSEPATDVQEGDLYYNTGDGKVYIRANISWQSLN